VPSLYLFDGWNLVHATGLEPAALVDRLVDYVAVRGARGVVVFDGSGEEATIGPLEVRFAPDADAALERLAAEHRLDEETMLVSSDAAVRETAGVLVKKTRSQELDLPSLEHTERRRSELADRLDPDTLARLEQLRRGR
jgi:predicted RNA-binding protein with PIN domain